MYGRIGGIVGNLYGTIHNSYNKVDIYVTGSGGNLFVGGISGVIMEGEVNNSYNRGNILVTSNNSTNGYIGGIIGSNSSSNSIFSNLYDCGNINIYGTFQSNLYAGGIFGYNRDATLENGCNIGNIISNAIVMGTYNEVGLIVGLNHTTGIIKNSYYLSGFAIQGIGTNWGVSEISAIDDLQDMPTILETVGDAFKEDNNNINNGYPILSWQ